jgi:nicotinamidase-related amidase
MTKNSDLHGNVPDESKVALLIIDMICDFEFEDGEKLFRYAARAAENIAQLKARAEKEKVPVVYVNDNFGKWQSDFKKLLAHSLKKQHRGHSIAERLKPKTDNYFVLKPKHSGFYSTTLDVLLEYLGAETLILTGVATDICILFTANDAYMRDFHLIVPRDCVAANTEKANRDTLKYMEKVLGVDTAVSTRIDFKKLKK